MTTKDLLLGSDNDLEIVNFDLQLTDNNTTLKQLLKQELKTFKGDWFLDVDKGLPYYQEILGQRNSIDAVRSIFIEAIKSVDGVEEIIDLELNLDGKNRTLEIKFTVLDAFSQTLNIEI
jgi:hypothetical protein